MTPSQQIEAFLADRSSSSHGLGVSEEFRQAAPPGEDARQNHLNDWNGESTQKAMESSGSDPEFNRRARWLADQLHVFFAEGNIPRLEDGSPDMGAAERFAIFLRIADIELHKGGGNDVEDAEARRVAVELAKLHTTGHFPDVAGAGLLVGLIHRFEAKVCA
jgi:hypothetical protein